MKYYIGIIDQKFDSGARQVIIGVCQHDSSESFLNWMRSCFNGDDAGWNFISSDIQIYVEGDLSNAPINDFNLFDPAIMSILNDLDGAQYYRSLFRK